MRKTLPFVFLFALCSLANWSYGQIYTVELETDSSKATQNVIRTPRVNQDTSTQRVANQRGINLKQTLKQKSTDQNGPKNKVLIQSKSAIKND